MHRRKNPAPVGTVACRPHPTSHPYTASTRAQVRPDNLPHGFQQRLLGDVDEALRDQRETHLQQQGLALEGGRLYLDPETGDLALGAEKQAENRQVEECHLAWVKANSGRLAGVERTGSFYAVLEHDDSRHKHDLCSAPGWSW
jgi:hypothetical protein